MTTPDRETMACREAFIAWYPYAGAESAITWDRFEWQAWKAAWSARETADKGCEVVAWQYRNVTEEGPSPFWHDINREQFEFFRNDPHAEVRELFTGTRASDADARDAERYRYILDCEVIAAKQYLPDLDVERFKAKRRDHHDAAIANATVDDNE